MLSSGHDRVSVVNMPPPPPAPTLQHGFAVSSQSWIQERLTGPHPSLLTGFWRRGSHIQLSTHQGPLTDSMNSSKPMTTQIVVVKLGGSRVNK